MFDWYLRVVLISLFGVGDIIINLWFVCYLFTMFRLGLVPLFDPYYTHSADDLEKLLNRVQSSSKCAIIQLKSLSAGPNNPSTIEYMFTNDDLKL